MCLHLHAIDRCTCVNHSPDDICDPNVPANLNDGPLANEWSYANFGFGLCPFPAAAIMSYITAPVTHADFIFTSTSPSGPIN